MFNISQDFAPPFKLIAPYFRIGTFFYLAASVLVMFFGADIFHLDVYVLSWVHLFLLGFVMMTMLGAMAQLIPVVLEVGHFSVGVFYFIWPLLLLGMLMLVAGFYMAPALLPYGGAVVLVSIIIFVTDALLTLRKTEKLGSIAIRGILLPNVFLLAGLIVGIVMALGFTGAITIDIHSWLLGHVYLLLGGYVIITVMGLSLILLPMFGLSHGFSERPINLAMWLISFGVIAVAMGAILGISSLKILGFLLSFSAVTVYFYQLWIIYKTRARKEHDVWASSMYVAFVSMLVSMVFGAVYLLGGEHKYLLSAFWVLFYGLFGFVIIGHLYKIVPFLVWFERFSPLVGKQKVPMLADMVPTRAAGFQFWLSLTGAVICLAGFLGSSDLVFKSGAAFLIMGALVLVHNVRFMMNFKEGL
ncbi:MAG: hypothetical protein GY814_12175 [Gammaproteobacteria bacterium]|nr:hypothetical protein [Gammaproteobacteria bacterium]